jgi:polyphosphate glucokinase
MQAKQLNNVLGVDVGGTFTKIGLVDTSTGECEAIFKIKTPKNEHPNALFKSIKEQISDQYDVIGFGIPCIVKEGITKTAPNIGKEWYGLNIKQLATEYFGVNCEVLNDADAAAMAEIKFGAIKNLPGVTIFLTFGTGIGTAIYHNNSLLLNTEFGRMALPNGIDNAELIASALLIEKMNLTWEEYAERVNLYLEEINKCFWPDNIVIGGGISDAWDQWHKYLISPSKIYKAKYGNSAGVIGSAIYARSCLDE